MLADRWGCLCWEIPPGGPARSTWYVRLGFRDIECLIDRYLLTQCKRDQTDGEKGKQDKHAPQKVRLDEWPSLSFHFCSPRTNDLTRNSGLYFFVRFYGKDSFDVNVPFWDFNSAAGF